MDVLYQYYPWSAVAPDDYNGPSNAIRWDDASKYYPIRKNLIREFEQNGISFWQSDQLSGTPSRPTVHWYGMLFYPITWLFFIFPFNTANSLMHIVNLFIAGLAMWLLLREHGIQKIAAILGAIVYMLNGYFIVWMSASFLPGMLALLPLACFFVERLLLQRKVIYALIVALLITWQFLLGYPPGSILFLTFFGMYCIFSVIWLNVQDRKYVFSSLALLGLAVVLALGLSALYLFPTLDQLAASQYMSARQSGHNTIPSNLVLSYLFPNYWGNPSKALGGEWVGWGNYCEAIAYWGIVPLILAIFGLFLAKKRNPFYLFAVAAAIFALSMSYDIWPLNYFRYLPGFSAIQPQRWQFGCVLSGSILSAYGLEHLLDLDRRRRIWSRILLCALVAVFAFIVATVGSPLIILDRFREFPQLIASHYWQIGLAVVGMIMVACIILIRGVNKKIIAYVLLGLVVLDLFKFGFGFNPYLTDEEMYPLTPGIRFLQSSQGLFRVAPWGNFPGIFPSHTANVYGISTITGHDHFRDLLYNAFLEPLMSNKAQKNFQLYGEVRVDQGIETSHQVLDVLNVRYIVTAPDGPTLEGFPVVFMGPDMRVYENTFAQPRTFGVCEYSVVDQETALGMMHDPDMNTAKLALLEQDPDIGSLAGCSPEGLRSEVVAYTGDEIVIETDFKSAGLLVLSERYEPGWIATLDDKPIQILRADYLLRAIAAPSGQHVIQLKYRSPVYLWGLGISLIVLILFCGISGYIWQGWRGALFIGLLIPFLTVLMFGQPFRSPTETDQRWVDIGGPPPESIAPDTQLATFKDGQGEIVFLGFMVDKTHVAPGDTLRLTLFWRSEEKVNKDYTAFTHLVDAQGVRRGQKDKSPLGKKGATSNWQKGLVVAEVFDIKVDPDSPQTLAHLVIGMYDSDTGERTPLFNMNGNRIDMDQLTLNVEIEIKE